MLFLISILILLLNVIKSGFLLFRNLFKKKSTFIAVGAGHLSGKEGVLNLLKEAGYTVSPIE
ncbi:MAG: TraB/GumN family protein [Sphingobacteriaceae bacterium]